MCSKPRAGNAITIMHRATGLLMHRPNGLHLGEARHHGGRAGAGAAAHASSDEDLHSSVGSENCLFQAGCATAGCKTWLWDAGYAQI